MRRLALLACLLAASQRRSQAQENPVDWENVPTVILKCLNAQTGRSVVKDWNPFYLRGDFDGDSKPDYFVRVIERATGKEGFALCRASQPAPAFYGAGIAVPMEGGYPIDDFRREGTDVWSVGRTRNNKAEFIFLEKIEAGSGYFLWNGQKLVWHQGSF